MDFFTRLNYSIGNEDWLPEEKALQPVVGDNAICVTASGDRALHFLMTDVACITAIDMNAAQNYLLDLKLAAIALLDYEKYLAFMGCTPTSHRLAILHELKPSLMPAAADYWEKHSKMITRGVIYQGWMERLTTKAAYFFNLVRGKKIRELFSFTDLEEQRNYVREQWDTSRLRRLFNTVLNFNYVKPFINDPGLYAFVDSSLKPGQYIYNRMLDCLDRHLARQSPLLQLIFLGKLLPEAYFPYLTYEGYKKIRRDLGRLQYRTGNIIEYLHEVEPGSIDVFSLSDIASYMPQAAFEHLLHGVYQAASPKARFCLRELMSKREIPASFTEKFKRQTELEMELAQLDSNFVYRFVVGTVQK